MGKNYLGVVISLTPAADAQGESLLDHFDRLDRTEAIRSLLQALEDAKLRIERAPLAGLPAPRPYPSLVRLGFRWIKIGAYWFAYTSTAPPGDPRRALRRFRYSTTGVIQVHMMLVPNSLADLSHLR